MGRNFADVRLASLNVCANRGTDRESRAGEGGVILIVAGLWKNHSDIGATSCRTMSIWVLTFARLMEGTPPGPKKTFKNATGNISIALS